jgi:protein-tyrosine-phosphatase
MKKILVVGSKNTYRSIIVCEYLKKALSDNAKTETEVLSAGIMAVPDIPADPDAVLSLEKAGIRGDFRSSPLNKQAAIDAVLIITMSEKIKNAILGKFPGMQSKVSTFAYFFSGKELEMAAVPGFAETAAGLIDKNLDRLLAI